MITATPVKSGRRTQFPSVSSHHACSIFAPFSQGARRGTRAEEVQRRSGRGTYQERAPENLCAMEVFANLICRPPRKDYKMEELGPVEFGVGDYFCSRRDLEVRACSPA